jgi:tetratricopeptide (TPR) repeat protein
VSVPLEAVLQPDFEVLRAALPTLPREAETLLRLFDGTRTLREVILASPLSEVAALRAASRLYATGVLLPEVLAREEGRAPYLPGAWEALERAPADEAASLEQPLVAAAVPSLAAPVTGPVLAPPASRALRPPSAPAESPALYSREESPLEAAARTLARVYQPKPPGAAAQPEEPWADDVLAAGSRRRSAQLTGLALGVAVVAIAVASFTSWRLRHPESPASAGPAAAAASSPAAVPAPAALPPLVSSGTGEASLPAAVKPQADSAPVPPPPGQHTLAEGIALYRAALPSAAVRVLDEVVQSTPDVSVAWLYLALARFDAGDVRGAEGAAMKAVALDPKEPRAHLLLAGIHLGRGERTKANAELGRVLALEPEGPEADDARRLLRDSR